LSGREDERVGEVEIERDEGAFFRASMMNKVVVDGTGQVLVENGRHVVSGLAENPDGGKAEVFVEFNFQGVIPTGSST
jgi:hypothetical protein